MGWAIYRGEVIHVCCAICGPKTKANRKTRPSGRVPCAVGNLGLWPIHMAQVGITSGQPGRGRQARGPVDGQGGVVRICRQDICTMGAGHLDWFAHQKTGLSDACASDRTALGGATLMLTRNRHWPLPEEATPSGHVLSHAPVTVYLSQTGAPFALRFVSPTVTELLGHTPEDFLHQPDFWLQHIHPEDRDAVLADRLALPSGAVLLRKYRLRLCQWPMEMDTRPGALGQHPGARRNRWHLE